MTAICVCICSAKVTGRGGTITHQGPASHMKDICAAFILKEVVVPKSEKKVLDEHENERTSQ